MAEARSTTQPHSPRDRVVEAAMALAAERPWDEIELTDIAARAEMTLADLRDVVPSKGAILGLFTRLIDHRVLSGMTSNDLAGEPAKERIFDVLMRRFDALAPYRAALKSILPALRRDPLALLAMNQAACNSMRYMLAGAGVSTEDHLAPIKIQGLAVTFARNLEVWLHDDDPGLARTMARLDRDLKRGGQLLARAEDLHRLTAPLRAFGEALFDRGRRFGERRRQRSAPPADEESVVV